MPVQIPPWLRCRQPAITVGAQIPQNGENGPAAYRQ